MKKKVKEVDKSYSELKEIYQRTKSNMENIKKELQKIKHEKEKSNHEIETLRKVNKIQIQAIPDKEKEIAITEKEKERVEQMKSQVIELQTKSKNMNDMNTMTTKANHQELIETIEKEKGIKQILVADNTGSQPKIFQGRGGFVKLGHFDKHFIK